MTRHILRRLGAIVVLVVAASILVFLIIRLIPGDPVVMMLGSNAADTSLINKVRHELGLDLPIYQQYFIWAGGLLHGNFGNDDLLILSPKVKGITVLPGGSLDFYSTSIAQ